MNEHQAEISVEKFLVSETPRIHYSLLKIAKKLINSIDMFLKSAQKSLKLP